MTRDKKIRKLAKKLVELSKEDGVVTEPRVAEVLTGLKEIGLRHKGIVLKTYLYYIRKAMADQTALVFTPGELSAEAVAALEANFSKLYSRSITAVIQNDPSLIAGVRVRIGDDLYDASIAGRLHRLAENIH